MNEGGCALETWKAEEVRRIWQRVQAGNRQGHDPEIPDHRLPEMGELITGELYDSRVLLNLSRYYRGETAILLRKMAQTDKYHAARLKKFFAEGLAPYPKTVYPASKKEPPMMQLKGCYERKLRRLEIYRTRVFDSQYGAIFEELAKKEQAHCRVLLKLLR